MLTSSIDDDFKDKLLIKVEIINKYSWCLKVLNYLKKWNKKEIMHNIKGRESLFDQ
jgi:hypothetical protein